MEPINDLRNVTFPTHATERNALLRYFPPTATDFSFKPLDCLLMLIRIIYADGVIQSPDNRELVNKLSKSCPLMALAWEDFRNGGDERCEVTGAAMSSLGRLERGPWGVFRSMFYHESLRPLWESPFLRLFGTGGDAVILELDCTAGNQSLSHMVSTSFWEVDPASGAQVTRCHEPEPLLINVWYLRNEENPLPFADLQILNVPVKRECIAQDRTQYILRACVGCEGGMEQIMVFSFNFRSLKPMRPSHIDGKFLRLDKGICKAYLLSYVWVGSVEAERRYEDVDVVLRTETTRVLNGVGNMLRDRVNQRLSDASDPAPAPVHASHE